MIKVFSAGELIPALSVFNTVSQGTVELGVGYPAYWAGQSSAAQIFAGIPFGMTAQQMNAWLIDGGGQELWEKVYSRYNLVPMSLSYSGMQMGGWFRKPINTVEDLKGLKIRVPGLAGKVMAKTGANVVLIAGGELYTAIERGTIDATEWVGPYLDKRMGLDKVAGYYYYPGCMSLQAILSLW